MIWWVSRSERIPEQAYRAIVDEDNHKLISAASAWEIATKYRIRKLEDVNRLALELPRVMREQGFQELPVTVDDGIRAGLLPGHHRDPFDRMLIAQALGRDLVVISGEALFDRYGVRRLW